MYTNWKIDVNKLTWTKKIQVSVLGCNNIKSKCWDIWKGFYGKIEMEGEGYMSDSNVSNSLLEIEIPIVSG